MRVLIVSDIHGNDSALSAVLNESGDVDELWCPGDIVGYGAGPRECIDLLVSCGLALRIAAGNHDLAALGKLPLADFIPEGRKALEWTAPRLSETERRWLDRDSLVAFPDDDLVLFHGSLRDPVWEYLHSIKAAGRTLRDMPAHLGLFGHTHVPMIYYQRADGTADRLAPGVGRRIDLGPLGDRLIINPGSVGQPRDGDPRASFMLLDTESRWVELRKIDYSINEAREKILAAGLPALLADRLQYGI